MRTSDFDFELPEAQIARYPADRRDESRLMVLDRTTGALSHHRFRELPALLAPRDLLVLNDARVLPARLFGRKAGSGGRVEILLVEPAAGPRTWRAMAAASKPLREGAVIELDDATALRVVKAEGDGFFWVDLPDEVEVITARFGQIPLPPYLGRAAEPIDAERYQTVFASPAATRSVAAPTAGLHFTPELFAALAQRGIMRAEITLDVGPGTFLPVRSDRLEDHVMHEERFVVTPGTAAAIEAARSERRVVAVGTTVVRTLESMGDHVVAGEGRTALFIRPGFQLRVVDRLITNFHLPRSTLLMLVSAFAGRERVLEAYRVAVKEGYRFFSYGDAMLIG
ncbi:MAG: tRNA preQ1(34) S-adenosylmethionine ribosyltransferase-isomerase QueA [Deltaproteobacteria bacterium]|nr:tRNA preQ1(34) S-adenosylmethionine ribosyltransferase-isomerase QueA [Deltaproteobacteria bacterium]